MGKTTFGEKIGYGFASLGDAAGYGFIGTFLLFFLTTVAGVSPAIAGTVAAVGSLWNALWNPIMGYLADKVYTKYGRRRPVMFAFAFPLVAASFLLFTNVDVPIAFKPIYYGALVVLFWTCYSGFFIPYMALGADYTSDYDDRAMLRLVASAFNMVGTMFSMVMPTLIVDIFRGFGMTLSEAWSSTGLLIGVITGLSILITVAASKEKDPPCRAPAKEDKQNLIEAIGKMLREYVSVAKLKPVKYLVAASLFSLVAYAMILSDMVYVFTYNKGLAAGHISICMLIRTLLSTACIPLVGKIILATDKRETLIGAYILGAVGMTFVRMTDVPGWGGICIYVLCITLCTSIYWQIMPGIFYDVCEYDKIVNGKNRTATIVSFQGLVEALAAGIGGQILGLILEYAGFDGSATVQTEMAQQWIFNCGTVIPIIFLLVGGLALYKYPITKKVYNEMLTKGTTMK